MSINPLTKSIQFGVASPPYQSKSAGTDFEDILMQIQVELKAARLYCTTNLLTSLGTTQKKQYSTIDEMNLFPASSLFKMKPEEFSLLDDLLLTALTETKMAVQKNAQDLGTAENSLESQVSSRYKIDPSKLGRLLKQPG